MAHISFIEMGLTQEEFERIKMLLGREPNEIELGMFAVMWSEHCSYKNSRPLLSIFPTRGPRVIQGPGENAGIIDIGDGQALVFKIESHNHPSAIEPYQGAATGVGGIVRDIFTMGARPVALLNSLRFGELDQPRVRELFSGVVAGISGYGNCIGIPNVGGEVFFHPSYRDNPLVNAMCVGLVAVDDIAYAVAGEPGSLLMLVGSKTGRDGIHGATFASEELSEQSRDKRPAVQVGDPFMEKLLIEACLQLIQEDLVVGMQDLGAAGLTGSVAEAASKECRGAVIDVLQVPRREKDMTPYEVMLSESQERMLIIPREGQEDRIRAIFERWGLDAAVIGRVTGDGKFRVVAGEQELARIPVRALTEECPVYVRDEKEGDYFAAACGYNFAQLSSPDLNQALRGLLASPNIASKKWVYSQYDHQVMTNTVIPPGGGEAALLRIKGTNKGMALTIDGNSRLVYLDPYRGGLAAVCEAARNIACVGAKPLAFTNCLNFGNPEKPDIYWQLKQAITGMAEAAAYLETPVVSGNVSLYNESAAGAVLPTPTVGMVGIIADVSKGVTRSFKQRGDLIILLGGFRDELGGSEYIKTYHGLETGAVPPVNLEAEKGLIELLQEGAGKGLFQSCTDISLGGLAIVLAKSAIISGMGFDLSLPDLEKPMEALLFSEAPGRVVVSLNPANRKQVEQAAQKYGIFMDVLGYTGGEKMVFRNLNREIIMALKVEEASQIWEEALACLMI